MIFLFESPTNKGTEAHLTFVKETVLKELITSQKIKNP